MLKLFQRRGLHCLSLVTILVLLLPSAALPHALPEEIACNAVTAECATSESANTDIEEASAPGDWPMAAANPQRTSRNTEEVRGTLNPVWYRVIEPYIASNVQIIAANGLLYVSTARGLYALNATNGTTAWVYATELPLGNSPTVYNGVVYVGGYDRKLHALDATTGRLKWVYEASAGFATNPLAITLDGRTLIIAGNRDGRIYAIEDRGTTPALAWRAETGGPIFFSSAYKDAIVYTVSNDAHAYAHNARTGALIWKSATLPGGGWHAFWPVVYEDPATGAEALILGGSNNYRLHLYPGHGYTEPGDIFPNRANEPRGTFLGPRSSDGTIDATRVQQYFQAMPWRRTYIVLNRATGAEVTFNFNGVQGYAPVLWHGTNSGNRYPAIVGNDGLLYQSNMYMSDASIPAGMVSSWKYGTNTIGVPSVKWIARDEPMAYSAGGNLVYWSHTNDRSAGAFDIRRANTLLFPAAPDDTREWVYFDYTLEDKLPGYNALHEAVRPSDPTWNTLFQGPHGSPNGIYGQHGYQNPPIPYGGRVYMHRSNAIIAFGNYSGQPTQVPMATIMQAPKANVSLHADELRANLAVEVRKMLAAGLLRPGYRSTGSFNGVTRDQIGDHLLDYWHDPSETLYTLSLALPHLPAQLQEEVKVYLRRLYTTYPPQEITHVGWRDGAPREPFAVPGRIQQDLAGHPAWVSGYGYEGWDWPPQMFYALWKYAEATGSAKPLFDASRKRLESPPRDAYLIEFPYVHNAYIAGYVGYLKLEALAGYPETASVRTQLTRLLSLRAARFDKDTPYSGETYYRGLSVARNFMYLVPELGQYLRDHAYEKVQEALADYSTVAPFWFVSNYDATVGEGSSHHFYDYHALFQARALILQEPGTELVKYLDVPAVQVGDLFYIQNLVATLDAGLTSGLSKTGSASLADSGAELTYTLRFSGYEGTVTLVDTLPVGLSAPEILAPQGTDIWPIYNASTRRITWEGPVSTEDQVTLRYRVTVETKLPGVLTNRAELSGAGISRSTASFTVLANARRCYLPLVMRSR
jgi:hypothetical protein